jgi:uncharacterized RDD family membrane protein YckC
VDSEKSIKFEIDRTLLEKSRTNTKVHKPRIEGKTVILHRAPGKKPPPPKFGLEIEKAAKTRPRRDLVKEAKKARLEKSEKVEVPPIKLSKRLMAFIVDVGIFLGGALVLATYLSESFISSHVSFMASVPEMWLVYSTELYFLRIVLPVYFVVFYLPCFLIRTSIGKHLMGIKIVNAYDIPANFGQFIVRELARPLSIVTVLGVLIGVFKPYRALHDYLAGTKPVVTQR